MKKEKLCWIALLFVVLYWTGGALSFVLFEEWALRWLVLGGRFVTCGLFVSVMLMLLLLIMHVNDDKKSEKKSDEKNKRKK